MSCIHILEECMDSGYRFCYISEYKYEVQNHIIQGTFSVWILFLDAKKSITRYSFPGIQFTFAVKKEEPVDPEVVKISHFDTRCVHEEWCTWHVHLAASQGRVLTVNIYKYWGLFFCFYQCYSRLLHHMQKLFRRVLTLLPLILMYVYFLFYQEELKLDGAYREWN
jgi:hypothetical protein